MQGSVRVPGSADAAALLARIARCPVERHACLIVMLYSTVTQDTIDCYKPLALSEM
jgi:hypothetical protein